MYSEQKNNNQGTLQKARVQNKNNATLDHFSSE